MIAGVVLVVAILKAAIAGPVFVWTSMSSSESEWCGNYPVAEYPAPDGAVKVVVFQRDCGATTDFSTQASVVSASDRLRNLPGNMFVADTNHESAPAGSWGGPELKVRWLGQRQVMLEHDGRARVFFAAQHVSGVQVLYGSPP